jgi:hypothetical protein
MKKSLNHLLLLPILLLLLCSSGVSAQSTMVGDYTVGSDVSDDFSSIAQCIDTLEVNGVSGAVVVRLDAGTYSEQIDIKSIPGASVTNSITFRGMGKSSVIEYTPTTSSRAVISVDGASHLIFDSLKVEAKGTYGIGFNLYGQADSITITNSHILLPNNLAANVCTGIANYSANDGTGTSFAKQITIQNDSISGGYIGIRLLGDNVNQNNFLIDKNTIVDFGRIGVLASSSVNSVFSANTISSSVATADRAISMWPTGANTTVINNVLELGSNVNNTRVLQVAGGAGSGGSSWGEQVLVANNMVRYFGTYTSSMTGIYTKHVNYMKIYNNTVQMSTGTGAVSLWLDALFSTSNIEVKNNNLNNLVSGGTLFRIHGLNATLTADYNNFYNPTGLRIWWKGTTHTTLAAYRTGSSQGTNAVSIDPKFISTSDLHVDTTNAAFDGLGTYLAEVTTDIDGAVRSTTQPDIGADEFDSQADVATGAVILPGNCLPSSTSLPLSVWIKNKGPHTISGVPVSYQLNNNIPVTDVHAGSILSNDSVLHTFSTTGNFSAFGVYTVQAYTTLRVDQNLTNDTSSAIMAITGLYSSMVDSVGTCTGLDVMIESRASSVATSFLWSDNSTSSTLSLDAADVVAGNTTYKVMISDVNGCIIYDSVELVASLPARVNLGSDTSLCLDKFVVFGTTISNGSYLWQDGSTSQTFTASASGLYHVAVNTGFNCTVADSVWLAYYARPVPSLNNAAVICRGDSLVLNPGANFATYLWSDQSTSSTLSIYDEGKVWVDIVDTNGCTASDTTVLYLNTTPDLDLGADTVLCTGSSLLLDAYQNWHTYVWQDNSVNSMYTVTGAGTYSVTITNGNNCSTIDTIQISEESSPMVNLGNDTAVCEGSGFTLNALVNRASYLWQDGSTAPSYSINVLGEYFVEVTNEKGCTARDTINVTVNPSPLIELGRDTTVGQGRLADKPLRIEAPSGYASYLWSDGSDNNFILVDGSTPLGQNLYSVIVTNEMACEGKDSMLVNVYDNASAEDLTYQSPSETIFPNPSTDKFTVYLAGVSGNIDLELYDMSGRPALSQKLIPSKSYINETIDVSNLSRGTYILSLRGLNSVKTYKIVVQ